MGADVVTSGDGLNYFWTALSRRLTATRNGRPIVPPSTRINNVVRRTRANGLITLYTGVLYRPIRIKLHFLLVLHDQSVRFLRFSIARKGEREGSVIFSQESNASLFVELISRWSMALGLIARVNEQRPRYVAG